jgi:O-antigen ligase
MVSKTQVKKSFDTEVLNVIFSGLIITTLYFQTNLNDPFNSPKLWILLLVSAWLTGYIFNYKILLSSSIILRHLFCYLIFFSASLLFVTLFTDFKYVAFFGETQRRNGFITYLALCLIMLGSAMFIRIQNIKKLYTSTLFVGILIGIYAAMQTTGNDFVKWNNPNNSIVGTLGNPNFAAAVMAIISSILFTNSFISSMNSLLRASSMILVTLLIILIFRSEARQGLLSLIIGIGIFLATWTYYRKKLLGYFLFGAGAVTFLFSVAGMLQTGPLKNLLYKPSVGVRGYYWRAGIEMFTSSPLTGVGMDRYGAYFKEFREVGYPLRYGYQITSTNAHNTFIQFFATGGIFLGTSYLLLNFFIFIQAIKLIKKSQGVLQIYATSLFSGWITFQAQSFVSIDNIGIAIWGWVLGGAIIGLSISNSQDLDLEIKPLKGNKKVIEIKQIIISSLSVIFVSILITLLYRAENNSYKANVMLNSTELNLRNTFYELQMKAINSTLNDPSYSINRAIALVQNGFIQEGLNIVEKTLSDDPRNQDALNGLSIINEDLRRYNEAIKYRLKMAEVDPWNAINYLALAEDYRIIGDVEKSLFYLEKIISFDKTSKISTEAQQLLNNQP